ncbi:MAG: hypothetical protein AAF720_13280 [Pseudomonadota bacterium]
MDERNDNQPPQRIIDPVILEQFEIQARSGYEWQARNLWIYAPFMLVSAAIFILGVFVFAGTPGNGDWVFGVFFGLVAITVGTISLTAVWRGYSTAKKMADALKTRDNED